MNLWRGRRKRAALGIYSSSSQRTCFKGRISATMPSSSSSARSRASCNSRIAACGLNKVRSIQRWNDAAKNQGVKVCECGLQCLYFTSFTNENPNRRFYRCQNYNKGECSGWEWFDYPLCNVASGIIPLLRDEICKSHMRENELNDLVKQGDNYLNEYHEEIANLKKEEQRWQEEEVCFQLEIQNLCDEKAKHEVQLDLERKIVKFCKGASMMLGVLSMLLIACFFF